MKSLGLAMCLLLLGCESGDEFVKCAEACKISGLKMVECGTNSVQNKDKEVLKEILTTSVMSCKCGEPLESIKRN